MQSLRTVQTPGSLSFLNSAALQSVPTLPSTSSDSFSSSSREEEEETADLEQPTNNCNGSTSSTTSDNNTVALHVSFRERFRSEIRPCQKSSYFDVHDINGRIIDIPESFAPYTCRAVLWKLVLAGTCVFTMIYGILQMKTTKRPSLYLVYTSNWAVIFSVLYSILNLCNSTIFASSRTPQPANVVRGRIRCTWITYTLAWTFGLLMALLFWPYKLQNRDVDDKVTFLDVACHGLLVLLVLLDGNFCNRIPIRLMHYYTVSLPVSLAFALWYYIYSLTDIGSGSNNPNRVEQLDDDATTDQTNKDTALSPDILERNDLGSTIVLMILLCPTVYFVVWALCSCLRRRKYVDSIYVKDIHSTTLSVINNNNDVEEGSVFTLR